MKHLIIAAISLTSVSAPAVAERHCTAPKSPVIVFNFWEHPVEVREDRNQAHQLTYSDLLYDQKVRTLEVCEAKGEDFFYDCDAPEYGTMDEVNPDYLGLTEQEFEDLKDANRHRSMVLGDALAEANCFGDG